INSLIALSRQLTRFKDNILAATLTRYYQSAFKHQTHFELKQLALEYWGNPQLTSRNKSWQVHVENPVLLMVQGWFAKDDLKLFFELLKGNRDVDHARLFY
ncbi:EH signature domain-containing protein, partial [Escherichia coli]